MNTPSGQIVEDKYTQVVMDRRSNGGQLSSEFIGKRSAASAFVVDDVNDLYILDMLPMR